MIQLENGIWYINDYYVYRLYDGMGGWRKNPAFNQYSGKILDLKGDNYKLVKDYFVGLLRGEIPPNTETICYVPSHDPERTKDGLNAILNELCRTTYTHGGNCVRRTEKIEKLSSGGSRNTAVHLRSIEIHDIPLIKGKNVLLLDDVTTTGNSLLGCKQLLMGAGARSVECISFAKTVH